MNVFSQLWNAFWSLWPKSYILLVTFSALCEAISVILFKFSGNRGWLSILGYVFGFFVVAFYAEATKYAPIGKSYPLYLFAVALFISIASVFVLHEKVSYLWFAGFVVAMIGIFIINSSLPSEA